jgi:16S rRNA (cytosine967-C5)-methyltransferase
VFDLASGNGIKAAQLAALGAEVVSVDNQASKLDRAKRNLARLGFIAQNVTHDLRTPLSEAPAPYVLLDAPCSGTGTLRGNPELRQRVTPNTITELAGLQQELLSTAATLCTDGGTFVYAVCSLQQPEAEDNARWFLETHPDFTALPFDLPVQSICQNYGHYVIPENGLDGFYIARFARA